MKTKQDNITTALVEPRQSARKQMADAAGEHSFQVRDILVPTDFSPTSLHALDYAVPLARQLGGQITLLHVMDWPVLPQTVENLVIGDAMTRTAKERLDALAHEKVPSPLLAKTLVRTGSSYQEITRLAQGLKSHLIILSTHGRTGFKRALLGSTAERVVRHAPCPVLTVREGGEVKSPDLKSAGLGPRINRILVPVDFSERSAAAVDYAVGLVRTMKARLALLHVVIPLPVRYSRFRAEMQEYDTANKLEARQKLEALAATVPKDIQVDVLLRQDLPPRGIAGVAREWRGDLIVLPTRGLTGAKYIVLGSTAEAVVRHAPCPVLSLGVASFK
ncbi:MAG: universal stress protein [Verrucomicrobia bacterium]|nr:universal stress protein [Verrucomicrobiota bacterium]